MKENVVIVWQHLYAWLRCVVRTASVGVACTLALAHLASASVFYEFDIIAQTGQDGLISIANAPSINDEGIVAFVGQLGTGFGNSAVFVGDALNPPRNITPGFVSSTRRFGSHLQINNTNQVVVRDQVSGSPGAYLLRIWEANTGAFTTIINTSALPSSFDAVFTQASINNNEEVVFSALDITDELLVTPGLSGFNSVNLRAPLFPMIADNGRIVVRAGNQTTDPILLERNCFELS